MSDLGSLVASLEATAREALERAEKPGVRPHGWPTYTESLARIRRDGGNPVDFLEDAAETMPTLARGVLELLKERDRLREAIEGAIVGFETLALTEQLNSPKRWAASPSDCRAVADVVRLLSEALAPKGEQ